MESGLGFEYLSVKTDVEPMEWALVSPGYGSLQGVEHELEQANPFGT